MQSTASDYFGSMVREYDSLVRRAVPVYGEMLERLIAYLPPRAERILDLGCGTGNLSSALAAHYPDAELTLVDGAAEMLQAARARIAPHRRVTTVAARFEELALEPGSFDLVTSCLALHHVTDPDALFRSVFEMLEPGGALVFADQLRGETDAHHQINWNALVDFWRVPGNLSESEMSELEEHARIHDHYVSVPRLLRTLEDAGFRDLDCVWRSWMWGILSAER